MSLIDEAESLVLHQFKDSPKLIGLIRGLVVPLEELAENLERLNHGRYIEEAEGQRLDILGHIVGQPRKDLEDEDYRAWIQVGIRLNGSSGTLEDVLEILRILLGPKSPILVYEHAPNDVVFIFNRSKFPLPALFNITRSAVPIGTKGWQYGDVPTASNFNWLFNGLQKELEAVKIENKELKESFRNCAAEIKELKGNLKHYAVELKSLNEITEATQITANEASYKCDTNYNKSNLILKMFYQLCALLKVQNEEIRKYHPNFPVHPWPYESTGSIRNERET